MYHHISTLKSHYPNKLMMYMVLLSFYFEKNLYTSIDNYKDFSVKSKNRT